ncbi:hypothetical protein [Synechococcus sp. MU1642]|uniref:hypothetical protein n=1 Tax=Synechococcus sp. MU1642 TaxID=2508348 RepID=UPI001CF879E7|nr:hypothetical protein [Synechococcus sp. MU1642]MCB4407195.1 hypothetical protein [Synechococcus sp. MU1642]
MNVLERLGCDPNQLLKRSIVERMKWLMDPVNFKKTKNMEAETLPAASYRSDEHQSQHQFEDAAADFKANQAARHDHPDTSPKEWRQRIFDLLHTENEPSMRAALIAL